MSVQVAKPSGGARTFQVRLRRRTTRDSLRCRKRGLPRRRCGGHVGGGGGGGGFGAFASFRGDGDLRNCILAIKIDEMSRRMFPIMFSLFNIVYWSYYTQVSR